MYYIYLFNYSSADSIAHGGVGGLVLCATMICCVQILKLNLEFQMPQKVLESQQTSPGCFKMRPIIVIVPPCSQRKPDIFINWVSTNLNRWEMSERKVTLKLANFGQLWSKKLLKMLPKLNDASKEAVLVAGRNPLKLRNSLLMSFPPVLKFYEAIKVMSRWLKWIRVHGAPLQKGLLAFNLYSDKLKTECISWAMMSISAPWSDTGAWDDIVMMN